MPMNKNLLDSTLDMARHTDVPVAEICRAVEVTPRWYYMLMAGDIRDPSVRKIQRLHDYLAEHQQPAANESSSPNNPTQGAA